MMTFQHIDHAQCVWVKKEDDAFTESRTASVSGMDLVVGKNVQGTYYFLGFDSGADEKTNFFPTRRSAEIACVKHYNRYRERQYDNAAAVVRDLSTPLEYERLTCNESLDRANAALERGDG